MVSAILPGAGHSALADGSYRYGAGNMGRTPRRSSALADTGQNPSDIPPLAEGQKEKIGKKKSCPSEESQQGEQQAGDGKGISPCRPAGGQSKKA